MSSIIALQLLINEGEYELQDQNCPECDKHENVVLNELSIRKDGKIIVRYQCTRCVNSFTSEVGLDMYEKQIIKTMLRITCKGDKSLD